MGVVGHLARECSHLGSVTGSANDMKDTELQSLLLLCRQRPPLTPACFFSSSSSGVIVQTVVSCDHCVHYSLLHCGTGIKEKKNDDAIGYDSERRLYLNRVDP